MLFMQGRNGKGNIYVWASGNGGTYFDSCAADGFVNSIYTIAVGSADQNGQQAEYDEDCSAKMAVTFSYNSDTFPADDDAWTACNQTCTTALRGKCTDEIYWYQCSCSSSVWCCGSCSTGKVRPIVSPGVV